MSFNYNTYINGTYRVILDSTGTKKYLGQEFKADFPDSLDIKITNKCMKCCPFCHESSNPQGEHGDLDELLKKLYGLPKGVELAIGGGDALLHPGLFDFLLSLKDHFSVALTVTWDDCFSNPDSIETLSELSKYDLIQALGISVGSRSLYNRNDEPPRQFATNHVYHVIPGITPSQTFRVMVESTFSFRKILILGFKQFGRSEKAELPELEFEKWREIIKNCQFFNKSIFNSEKVLAFDNLAIEQLKIRDMCSDDVWNSNYMGNEFSHSMYVDAVNKEYAPTSRSPRSDRESWDCGSVIDYFKKNHD